LIHNKIILSTAYFPPIEYFAHISQSKKFLIEEYENYNKQSFRNRCYISGSNQLMPLSIPIARGQARIRDIQISYHNNWNLVHWKSIKSYYNNSPFFLYYRDDIEPFLFNKYKFLLDLNNEILDKIMELILLNLQKDATKSFHKCYPDIVDLRYSIHPKINKTDKIFSIEFPEYHQVFETKFGFIPNLSILDLLFNEGPNTLSYLRSCKISKNPSYSSFTK